MSRYHTHIGLEGEYQPGSRRRILKNLRGINSARQIGILETDAFHIQQELYVDQINDDTTFTASLIRKMHRDWLGSIYAAWAGNYRTVEMQKGSFRWPPAMLVSQNMENLETEVLRKMTPCTPAPIEIVAERLACVHADFLLIHPFREGNGRLARWIADLMISQADLPTPDYHFEGRGSRDYRRRYLNAVIAGYAADYSPLAAFFEHAIRSRLREDT